MKFVVSDDAADTRSALVLLPSSSISVEAASAVAERLRSRFRAYVLVGEMPSFDQVLGFANVAEDELERLGAKHATFVGIGSGGSVAQALAIRESKLMRRLVLLQPLARLSPTLATRMIDRIERWLPLGLPLRKLTADFDSRPMLHRIRCPVFVLTGGDATQFETDQAKEITNGIPNAWLQTLPGSLVEIPLREDVVRCIEEFVEIPAKRPQKNRG